MAVDSRHRRKRNHGQPRKIAAENPSQLREILASALDSVIVMDHEGKISEFNPAAEKTFGFSRAEAVGKELAELIIPAAQREAHRRGFAHYRNTPGGPLLNKRVELTAKRADNTEFPIELTVTKIGTNAPPRFVGFVRDITERKRAEEEIQRHRQRAAILHEINAAITSSLDLRTVLDLLLEKIDLFLPYSYTAVRLYNKETATFQRVASKNIDEKEWRLRNPCPGRGLARTVFETGSPLMIANVSLDSRTLDPEFFRKHGVVSYLGLPLIMKGEALGVISFFTKEEHEFTDDEIEFLSTLAREAAIAIHNAQLYENARRQAAAIQQSEERFRIIARATNDVVWDWDLVTNRVWRSDGVRTLFGYSGNDVGPDVDWWFERIHPDDRDRVTKGIHALIGGGNPLWSDEYRYRRADDSYAQVFDRGYAMRDEAGIAFRVIGATVDITAQKQALERLAESETRLRTILDSEPECVKILSPNGTLLQMNPAGLAMIEADSADQVIGKSVLPLVVPENRQSFQTFMETISRGESAILQFQVVGLKGTRRWLESHAVPMRDADGQIFASLSITRDVTEQKRLEKEILEISETEQRRLGQDLHDGLGQHLAGLACLMKGLEQKLAIKSEPEQTDAALLTSLVNDAIAQTRSLARGLYPVELEANGLMAALEELACNTAKIFNISCLFYCDEPVLIHDNSVATHLYRIAQGAVDNAIKHSNAKQILIGLSKSDGKMLLSVSDNGVGIEDVSQLNKGMGLRIMRHRVEMIKGSLEIRRGDRGGTVVTCSL